MKYSSSRNKSSASSILLFVLFAFSGCPPQSWPPPAPPPVIVQGFDAYADGTSIPSGTAIQSQFSHYGIVLDNAKALKGGLYPDIPSESSPNVLISRNTYSRVGTITIRFVQPSDRTSPGEVSKVGVVFIDVDSPSEQSRLEVYDAHDVLLASQMVPVGDNGSRHYVEVHHPGISYARCVLAESGDGAAVDDLTYTAVLQKILIIEGYPAVGAERDLIEFYLRRVAGKEGDTYYVSNTYTNEYFSIHIGTTAEEFLQALQTPGAYVGYTGHSNYGLGVMFSDLPDKSKIEWVRTISDFLNISTPYVAVDWRHLVEAQAYPNLWFSDEEIARYPMNYCTPIGLQRFPNNDNVGVCQNFGPVQGEGLDRYHYHLKALTGKLEPRLIVRGSNEELPSLLRYAVLYYRSCNSGNYYSENFTRGILFHTVTDSLIGAQDIFVKGIISGWDWETIKYNLNRRQNNNDYFDFTQWNTYSRCDPRCD